MQALAQGCPMLEKASIFWCDNVGNRGMDSLVKSCQKLKYVQVQTLPLLTANAFSHFCTNPPSALEVLVVAYCKLFDFSSFEYNSKGFLEQNQFKKSKLDGKSIIYYNKQFSYENPLDVPLKCCNRVTFFSYP